MYLPPSLAKTHIENGPCCLTDKQAAILPWLTFILLTCHSGHNYGAPVGPTVSITVGNWLLPVQFWWTTVLVISLGFGSWREDYLTQESTNIWYDRFYLYHRNPTQSLSEYHLKVNLQIVILVSIIPVQLSVRGVWLIQPMSWWRFYLIFTS